MTRTLSIAALFLAAALSAVGCGDKKDKPKEEPIITDDAGGKKAGRAKTMEAGFEDPLAKKK